MLSLVGRDCRHVRTRVAKNENKLLVVHSSALLRPSDIRTEGHLAADTASSYVVVGLVTFQLYSADMIAMKYVQAFLDETLSHKRLVRLETRYTISDSSGTYVEKVAREGVAIRCISEDGIGVLRLRGIPAYSGRWRDRVAAFSSREPPKQRHCRTRHQKPPRGSTKSTCEIRALLAI